MSDDDYTKKVREAARILRPFDLYKAVLPAVVQTARPTDDCKRIAQRAHDIAMAALDKWNEKGGW